MEENYLPLNLPSKGLPYQDLPNFNLSEVKIRTLKGKDEKLLAELTYDNFERKFLVVLRNIVKGIDPEKLTIGDRLYILIWEAINSYSKDFDVEHTCENCFEKIISTIDLSSLEVIELPSDFKEPYSIKLSNGDTINVRLFRVEDEIKISDYEKTNNPSWVYRYALALIDDKGIWDRVNYLENLDVKDFAKIRAFHDKFYHGPKMEAKYVCQKCGGSGLVPVPFRIEMLFPYGKTLTKYFGNAV